MPVVPICYEDALRRPPRRRISCLVSVSRPPTGPCLPGPPPLVCSSRQRGCAPLSFRSVPMIHGAPTLCRRWCPGCRGWRPRRLCSRGRRERRAVLSKTGAHHFRGCISGGSGQPRIVQLAPRTAARTFPLPSGKKRKVVRATLPTTNVVCVDPQSTAARYPPPSLVTRHLCLLAPRPQPHTFIFFAVVFVSCPPAGSHADPRANKRVRADRADRADRNKTHDMCLLFGPRRPASVITTPLLKPVLLSSCFLLSVRYFFPARTGDTLCVCVHVKLVLFPPSRIFSWNFPLTAIPSRCQQNTRLYSFYINPRTIFLLLQGAGESRPNIPRTFAGSTIVGGPLLFLVNVSLTLPPLLVQGKDAEAEQLYERSQAIQEKALGPDHPNVATVLVTRVRLLTNQVRAVRFSTIFWWRKCS